MEKVIFALWRDGGVSRDVFNDRLLSEIGPKLGQYAHAVRINVQDEAVAGGTSTRLSATHPQMDAFVQLWVDISHDEFRAPIDALIREVAPRFSAWSVRESAAIPNTRHPTTPGQRTFGFSQIVLLGKPHSMSWDAWRDAWHRLHTRVGIDTQSNFEYLQNLVVTPLTYGAADYAGIIEECFPAEAQHDEAVFYDAIGDPEKAARNLQIMMESCARFIDFNRLDCIPTSQFELKPLPWRA